VAGYRRKTIKGDRMRVFLLSNGRVIVGAGRSDNGRIIFTRAWIIEKWGTTRGIPELAEGPKTKTTYGLATDLVVRDNHIILSLAPQIGAWPTP